VAAGNTLGKTPQASRAIFGLAEPPSRVMASRHRFGRARRPVHRDARSRDWRLAFGVDGCMLGLELTASGLDDSPLRYAFQWICGHSAAVATHWAEMLAFVPPQTVSRSHNVRGREATQCWRKIRSVAPLCPACRAARAGRRTAHLVRSAARETTRPRANGRGDPLRAEPLGWIAKIS
jgi:hypothetical protein